jgi:hypothetical protein
MDHTGALKKILKVLPKVQKEIGKAQNEKAGTCRE